MAVRQQSENICRPLAIEDYCIQPMVDASPPKWHLAHTSWFFETFLLKPFVSGYQPFHRQYEYLFNSYYNGVGSPFPRARRGSLSRPTVAEVYAYRQHVDGAMAELWERAEAESRADVRLRLELGIHHEQQHQELLFTDLKYNLGHNPLFPPYRMDLAEGDVVGDAEEVPLRFTEIAGGVVSVGSGGEEFCFDNELPRHEVLLSDFALADRLVTNGEYRQFMEAGGYRNAELWLSDGWAWLQSMRQHGAAGAPLYWQQHGDEFHEYRLSGLQPVNPLTPVTHVSFYEADAYARWAGARLPREQEWEHAASGEPVRGNFVESQRLHPAPAKAGRLAQMFGDVWEWTASPYGAYPGYQPLPGTLGEYNGKFMSNQLVLRGGSCVTPADHPRASYRNFFYPSDRWQFTGIRLAVDR